MPGDRGRYYYANLIARIYLQSIEEVMGKNGLNANLNMARLPYLIDPYPQGNWGKEFDSADYSALNQALENMCGPRGGMGLALRAGRASFARGLQGFGALHNMGDVEEKSSASRRLRALPAVRVFVNFLYTKIPLGRCRMNLCRMNLCRMNLCRMNLMGGDDG